MIPIRRSALSAALLAALALPAAAELTFPIPLEQRACCYALWEDPDGEGPDAGRVYRRDAAWPSGAGLDVTIPCAPAGPCYTWVRQVRSEPPEIDSRLQEIPYPCPEAVDLQARELRTTCTAGLRSEEELIAAIESEARERKLEALTAGGVTDPEDIAMALALLLAERKGQTLAAQDEAFLAGLQGVGVDDIRAISDRAAEIIEWVQQHPGMLPAIGPAEWPPADGE